MYNFYVFFKNYKLESNYKAFKHPNSIQITEQKFFLLPHNQY